MPDAAQTQAQGVVATCLGYRTRKLAREVTRVYNDRLRPLGLTIAELNLLAAIAAQGAVQPVELGRAMALEKSTLSRNCGRLTERGWVEARTLPDGRGVRLAVTAAGQEALLRALPAWRKAQERARALVAATRFDPGAGEGAP